MKKGTKPMTKNLTVLKAKPPTQGVGTSDYITLAIERGMTPEVISKLIDNAERVRSINALEAFDKAMAKAKSEIPPILKTNQVDFESQRTGQRTNYKFEDFASVAALIDPVLAKQELSYRFRSQSDEKGMTLTCIIYGHGHREENSLWAPNDQSGNKNPIQAIGSTQTYLQRYTLKAALGLAASTDDDARGGRTEKKPTPAPIAPKKVAVPHDPETGEIKPPHAIDVPKTDGGEDDWIGYGSKFLAAVKCAKNKSEIDDWLDLNNQTLTGMETVAPKIYKRLMSAIVKQ